MENCCFICFYFGVALSNEKSFSFIKFEENEIFAGFSFLKLKSEWIILVFAENNLVDRDMKKLSVAKFHHFRSEKAF